MNAPDANTSSEGWRKRLRAAVSDDLVEVRYCTRKSQVDFLLFHRKGRRRDAIGRFLEALPSDYPLDFDFRTVETGSGDYVEFRDYLSV